MSDPRGAYHHVICHTLIFWFCASGGDAQFISTRAFFFIEMRRSTSQAHP